MHQIDSFSHNDVQASGDRNASIGRLFLQAVPHGPSGQPHCSATDGALVHLDARQVCEAAWVVTCEEPS